MQGRSDRPAQRWGRESREGTDQMTVERHAVRAIILTPASMILLLRVRPPGSNGAFWMTPGGGIEPCETAESALRRELKEEIGLERLEVGPLVWQRRHAFDWGDEHFLQHEEYYIVRVLPFEPQMSDPVEKQALNGFRWWALADLAITTEPVTPPSLSEIVQKHLAGGAQQHAWSTGC